MKANAIPPAWLTCWMFLGLASSIAAAEIFVWDPPGGPPRWAAGSNWAPFMGEDIYPVGNDTAIFTGDNDAESDVIDLDAPGIVDTQFVGSLVFGPNARPYTIGLAGQTLNLSNTLAGASIIRQSTVFGDQSILAVVELGPPQLNEGFFIFNQSTHGRLRFLSEIVNLGVQTFPLTLVNVPGATTEVSGPIVGRVSVVNAGGGTLILNASNTFEGSFNTLAGVTVLGPGGSVGTASGIGISHGAEFRTVLRTVYTMKSNQQTVFGISSAGGGSAGLLTASTLDITSANVAFYVRDDELLDDPFYVIAECSQLIGSSFASVQGLPVGYTIDYNFGAMGNQIALVQGACTGDLNADLEVDLSDLTLLLANFGQSGEAIPGDLDADDDVDLSDLTLLLANFGTVCG